jgi:hypothetical protein
MTVSGYQVIVYAGIDPIPAAFALDGQTGPRRVGHGRWQGGDAPSARAASPASSAALVVLARCHLAGAVDPYASGHARTNTAASQADQDS